MFDLLIIAGFDYMNRGVASVTSLSSNESSTNYTVTENSSFSKLSASSQQFKGDGRTHCSHMTFCAEATYFLENCPNTKMDGNNDGISCERQWCN